ncbi:hypothetical protein [Kibdelosporangium aridum]
MSFLIGLTYLDDQVRVGFAASAAAGFILVIAAAITVAHYAALTNK